MEGLHDDSHTSSLLERLPPIEHAPILEKLGSLGLRKFRDEYAIPTPTLPNGIVDHQKLVEDVSALVSSQYRWRAPFFDEHHLHWKGYYYNPGLHGDSTIPKQFRDLNIHKLWIPREFHDFIHAVTIPPDVPHMDVMAESVEQYRHKEYMYTISSEVITLRERDERAIPLPRSSDNEILRVRDPISKRIVADGLYEERRRAFIDMLEEYFYNDLPPDLTHLSSLQLEQVSEFEEVIPQIRRGLKESIALANNRRRRGRAVRLLLELPPKCQPDEKETQAA
jgi:hypothetical protein